MNQPIEFYEQYDVTRQFGWTPSIVEINGGVATLDSYTPLAYVRHTFDQMRQYLQRGTGRPINTQEIVDYLYRVADRFGINRDLAYRQIQRESGFDPTATSPKGAVGVAQFMADTARDYGLTDRTDPYASLDAWGAYMRDLLQRFNGDQAKALAAYNWGQGNVFESIKKWGESWLSKAPKETRDYVAAILQQGADEWFDPTTGMPAAPNSPGAIRRPGQGYGSKGGGGAGEFSSCGTFDVGCYLDRFFTGDTAKDVGKRIGLVVLAGVLLAVAIISLR